MSSPAGESRPLIGALREVLDTANVISEVLATAAQAASTGAKALIIGIDPTSLAISVAINLMVEVLLQGCDQQDMGVGMLNGSGMCHEVGEYCASKILGICVQKARGQCCINTKLAGGFALVMFSRNSCGYCRVQWPIIERFREETGWQVTLMDLDRRPDLGARFGVSVTPTTMVIRRGSAQRMVIATGVEAYPALAQIAYQAVKLLTGDIKPQQFLTGAGEEGGFFDALANGPVGASDAVAADDGGGDPTGGREP